MAELLREISNGVAVVTLNRPEKLNALSADMLFGLTETFDEFSRNPDLRVVILTGAGDKAFCAGTDLANFTETDAETARSASQRGQTACTAIESCPVPVIAALNGLAAGGGFELALSCHLRIAEEHVRFSLPETRHGLLPGYGGTQRLPRIIGTGRAVEIILAGGELTAAEAERIGLVNRLTVRGEALDAARDIAGVISGMAPLAVRACLRAVNEGFPLPLEQGLQLETELFADLFNSADAREGAAAFLAKRKPRFTGQ